MNYRLLKPEEFDDRLIMFCLRNGIPVPDPKSAVVAVAEKEGKIVYCHMAQLQLHLDNQCRDRDFKGYINIPKVVRVIEEKIPKPGFLYTYPSYENGVRLAELSGFHKAPFPLMIKELR